MPNETIGDSVWVITPDHPPRKDSPEYLQSRKALMARGEGCIVCGGKVDVEDHHGGGLYLNGIGGAGGFLGFGLHGMEWSLGWGADPAKIARFVDNLNVLLKATNQPTYDDPITDTCAVMRLVDSVHNANVPLCLAHHRGHPSQHTPDANGNEACGRHEIPEPVWAGQLFCDWSRWNMWGGSTGTIAVAPHPDGDGKATVMYVHHSHPEKLTVGDTLVATHPHARAAHAVIN